MHFTPLKFKNYSTEHKMSQQPNISKRKRSFKRRRFMENTAVINLAIIFLMAQNLNRAQAVPAIGSGYLRLSQNVAFQPQEKQQHQLWHQRYIRDVGASLSASLQQQQQQQKGNHKDSLIQQSSSTEAALEQPQGQCLLDGEYVPETTVFCEKQLGCRAIQKTGHCCPDYKCDCQKDGKTYLNGDKLVDPETPCKVCYCQGGEILCSSVTCFHRDDCTPKYIPAVCCPEYDNCPVATSESTNNKTFLADLTTTKPEIHQAENNPKITIKEITKPIEIRITNDNKAISIQQMLKPSTTTTSTVATTTTSTTILSTTTTAPAIISANFTTPIPPRINAIKTMPTLNTGHNQLDVVVESSESLSVDNINKNAKSPAKGAINSADTLKLSASVAYPSTVLISAGTISTLAPLDSSVEVDDPVPALSVFSTQGLPDDPSKVNIKREYFITTEGLMSGAAVFDGFGSGEYPNSELLISQTAQSQDGYNTPLQQSSAELDPDTAGSDNIYHIILTTDGPRLTSTAENYLALKGISTTEGLPFDDLADSSSHPLESSNYLGAGKNYPTTQGPLKEDHSARSSTESSAIHHHLDDDDSALPPESNPAYPSLPEDDFSLRDNNFQINDSDDIQDEPRSISGGSHGIASSLDSVKSTKHLDEHTYGSGSGSGSGMLIDEVSLMSATSTEGSGYLMSSHALKASDKSKSNEAIQFMYSGEDSSEETRIANATDFKLEKTAYKDSKEQDSSFEASGHVMEFDIGSGSGELNLAKPQKEREPTTARPNKKSTDMDIDGLQDASGNGPVDDPKLDAESLKLDETPDDTPANPTKSAKNNILSVKLQPTHEQQFQDDLH